MVKADSGHSIVSETIFNTSPAALSAVTNTDRKCGKKMIIMAEAAVVGQGILKWFDVSGQRRPLKRKK